MIDTANTRTDGQRAPRALPEPAAAPAAPAASAATGRATRRPRLTYDQFLLGQIPLIVTLALVFSFIAYAARSQMPVGGATTGAGGAAGAASGAAADAPITAFAAGTATQQVLVAADPTGALKWDRTVYEAQAGDVTFVVSNKSSSSHNFAVEGPNVKAQGANFGANTTTTYTLRGLKPGEYQIICNFPGHRAAGMVATLIVR